MTELKKAATAYANIIAQSENRKSYCKEDFIAGAQWQAKQSPWISVEERLPEKDKNVLLKVKNCGVLIGLGMNVKDSSLNITHWCPIPE